MLIKNNTKLLHYINELHETYMRRSRLYTIVVDILNNAKVSVDAETVKEYKKEFGEYYIKGIIAEILQVDPYLIDNGLVKEIADNLTVLDDKYYENLYVKTMCDKMEIVSGSAVLKSNTIEAGDVDFCKSPLTSGDLPPAPRVYYAPEDIKIYQLWIHDDLWMTLSPNEVCTMELPVDMARGKVLTCGLGIGYYAIMAAAKDEVDSVTVVENNESVIRIFNEYIKPLFPSEITAKIQIEQSDAYTFLYDLKDGKYDYCFIDLWQGVYDSEHYFKAIHATAKFKKMRYDFWIEDSFLAMLREEIFNAMICTAVGEPVNNFIFPFVEKTIIGSKEGVDLWLAPHHIRKHVYSCIRKVSREAMDTIE